MGFVVMHASPSLRWVLERVSHLRQGLSSPLLTSGRKGCEGGGVQLDTQSWYPQGPSQIATRESIGFVVTMRTKQEKS